MEGEQKLSPILPQQPRGHIRIVVIKCVSILNIFRFFNGWVRVMCKSLG